MHTRDLHHHGIVCYTKSLLMASFVHSESTAARVPLLVQAVLMKTDLHVA
jgi:hypothetical protein